jgi:signal peptidase II
MKEHYTRWALIGLVVAGVVGADRWLKSCALALWRHEPVDGGVLALTYFENTYIAFSIPVTGAVLEIVISAIIIALVWFVAHQVRRPLDCVTWGAVLMLAGAMGNFYDRARYGFVIDYIQIGVFPVFNFADAAITIGAIIIGGSLWYSTKQSS